ncbi:MAG TPA: hypothetical protein VK071_04050 [Tissierellales bacterium]|nr:hypothetical protein [Tissierellales bacterium]
MATYTGEVLIGNAHLHHGGILPEHRVYLSENGRLSLILRGEDDTKGCVWVPTVKNTIDDTLLMISAYTLKDKDILRKMDKYKVLMEQGFFELSEYFSQDELKELYELNKRVLKTYSGFKIVLNALEGSIFLAQLGNLEDYDIDMEVCRTIYSQRFISDDEEKIVSGKL